MTEMAGRRRDGVTVVRARSLDMAMRGPSGTGRATAFDFAGTGAQATWIGTVTLPPKANTGAHHHGRHEVAVYVVKGPSQMRSGERLALDQEAGPGELVYFPPSRAQQPG